MAYAWTPEEAAETRRILSSPELQQKHVGYQQQIHRVLYWGLLAGLVVANFLVGLVLVPVLIVLPAVYMALVLFVVGAAFGLFFQLLINDLAHLDAHHRMLAGVIIPLAAVANIFAMTAMGNAAAARLGIHLVQHPFWLIMSYVIAFLLPSILSEMIVQRKQAYMIK